MDFLQQQGVPVAIDVEHFNVRAVFCKVVFMQIFGKTAAVVIRRHVDVGAERGGQYPHTTGLEKAKEFIKACVASAKCSGTSLKKV